MDPGKVFFCAFFLFPMGLAALLTEKEYEELPATFLLEEYNNCDNYCSVHWRLRPINKNNTSNLWKTIKKTQEHYAYYDHGHLHRGVCLDRKNFSFENLENVDEFAEDGLENSIENFYCSSLKPKIGYYDILVMIFLGFLLFSVIYATCLDWGSRDREEPFKVKSVGNEVLMGFSIIKNWENLGRKKSYEFVEGLRTYTMIVIIVFHNIVGYISAYLDNPHFVEKMYENHLIRCFFFVSMFVVQVYFMLSAMFLMLQILKLYEHNRKLTFKDVLLLILNRYCRLIGPQIVLLLIHTSSIPMFSVKGILKEFVEFEYTTCHKYWYLALIFLNNSFGAFKMCVIMSWYVAVDFQLYVISVFLIYTALKLKIGLYKTVAAALILCISSNAVWNYSQGFPVTYPMSPKSFTVAKHNKDGQYISLYLSTYSNAATFMIGLLFGLIANRKKDRLNPLLNYSIMMSGLLLPFVAVISAQFQYNAVITAILSAIVKPVYSMGFGLLVVGMIFSENTIFHKFYGWRPVVFLGNFTYSTYMFHFGPVLGKLSKFTHPIHLSVVLLVGTIIWDIFISYVTGMFGYFCVEMPILSFVKTLVPNVKINEKKILK